MAVKVARGQVTIIDQNDAVSLQAFIGSSQPLTQVYNLSLIHISEPTRP